MEETMFVSAGGACVTLITPGDASYECHPDCNPSECRPNCNPELN